MSDHAFHVSQAAKEALSTWLDHQKALKDASPHTITAYHQDVFEFLAFLTEYKGQHHGLGALAKITITDMRAWMAQARSTGLSARSLARKLSAVKSFYRWLAEREGFEPTAVLSTRAPKFHNKLPRPLSEEAARDVLDMASTHSNKAWINARDTAVLILLWGCGLRISEALGLQRKDAPLGESLRILGKGRKERIVPVLPIARDAVEAYLRICPHPQEPNAPLFRAVRGGALRPSTVQKLMQSIRAQLGLPSSATPHAMRHSFATQLLAAGGDLRAIQELLGHASLSTTQNYTAVETSKLLDIYTSAHPMARRKAIP